MVTSVLFPARDFRSQLELPIPPFSLWERLENKLRRLSACAHGSGFGPGGSGRRQGISRLARAQTINQRPGIEARVWWHVLAKSRVKDRSVRSPVSVSAERGSGADQGGVEAATAGGAKAEPQGPASATGEGSNVALPGSRLGTRILVAMQQGAS